MFSRRKNTDGRIRNSFELISIHIPKTAGTSFRGILQRSYGERAVLRVDIGLYNHQLRINEQQFDGSKIAAKVKVAHGHFSPALFRSRFEVADDIPLITWLRDPVERVISNYFYLKKRLEEELQEEKRNLNILSKMQRSLMEYARDEVNRNRIHKFLDGIRLEELFFIGIQESFQEDLQQIARLLNWQQTDELHHNRTINKPAEVSEEARAEIARLNELDIDLYQRALAIRKARIG